MAKTTGTPGQKVPPSGQDKTPGRAEERRCSFCGNLSSPSRLMIAGPPAAGKYGLFIGEDCVDLCVRVFIEAGVNRWALRPAQEGETPHKG
ncbi:MAG: ClpX C4-type zinc finger protein [Treponema sp.]|jgi:hypothetical protein|nr:ClpX C4-type zinc finger protein [Treponema sp.]